MQHRVSHVVAGLSTPTFYGHDLALVTPYIALLLQHCQPKQSPLSCNSDSSTMLHHVMGVSSFSIANLATRLGAAKLSASHLSSELRAYQLPCMWCGGSLTLVLP